MRKQIIALLLIVHGWIHIIFQFEFVNPVTSEHVGWNGTSWILTGVLDNQSVLLIGRILWGAALVLFILAGIGVLREHKKWREIDVLAAIVSLLAFILFWNGLVPFPLQYIVGPSVAIVTLVSLLVLRRPPDSWIFEGIGKEIAYPQNHES
ncbi:MAG: hypothetical protein C4K48_05465 [Candidatus Thorarchaeota archaeon]|nr:MAG: hypothetical protein C4K48_05465 [Candidatus Thorarchaeota archaeon]